MKLGSARPRYISANFVLKVALRVKFPRQTMCPHTSLTFVHVYRPDQRSLRWLSAAKNDPTTPLTMIQQTTLLFYLSSSIPLFNYSFILLFNHSLTKPIFSFGPIYASSARPSGLSRWLMSHVRMYVYVTYVHARWFTS